MNNGYKGVTKYIGKYITIVLAFAVVNWLTFKRDTTAFLVSEQMNKHLVRYDLLNNDLDLASFHANAKDVMPVSVEGFAAVLSPEMMRLSIVNDSLQMYERQLSLLKWQMDSLVQLAGEERDSIADAYRKVALQKYEQALDSLSQVMARMDSSEFVENGMLLKKANLEYEYAVENKKVLDHISENLWGSFSSQTHELLADCSSEIENCSRSISSLEFERKNLVRSIRDEVNRFHLNRSTSVTFLDFLYYSICVSTTVSFGDIAPNNGWTRLLAVVELLSCLVLVSFVVNGITMRKS